MTATHSGTMKFRLLLPTEVLVDQPIVKLIAEARNGYFCLLPRHCDFVTALVPGVLTFHDENGVERFVAIDEGVLVKCAEDVMVSTYDGVCGDELERLQELVEHTSLQLDEHERKARTALSRLEAGTLRKFKELEGTIHG